MFKRRRLPNSITFLANLKQLLLESRSEIIKEMCAQPSCPIEFDIQPEAYSRFYRRRIEAVPEVLEDSGRSLM